MNIILSKFLQIPQVPWNAKDGVKAVLYSSLLLFLASFGSYFLGIYIFGAILASEFLFEHMKPVVAFSIVFQILSEILFLYFYSAKKYQITWKDFGFRPYPIFKTIIIVLSLFLLGAIVQNLMFFFMYLLGMEKYSETGSIQIILENEWVPLWALFTLAVVIAPVLEELVFRGFLLSGLLKRHSASWSILFASFLFAVAHFNLVLTPVFMALGIILSLSYLYTKSLWPGIAFHAINNCIALLILF